MSICDEIKIKGFGREDKESIMNFGKAMNELEKMDINVNDQIIEFALSMPEFYENFFLAYHGDQLVGIASCQGAKKDVKSVNFEVLIHPHFRKQGIGSMLYERILQKAKQYEIKNVMCFAKENMQDSVKFAEQRGYKVSKYFWKMELDNTSDASTPSGDFTIRRVELKDISAYVDIMNAGFKNPGEDLYKEDNFQIMFADPDKYVFFVEQDGKIISTAAIGMQRAIDKGYIHNVTVYKDYRGKGFGEVTLRHCVDKIKQEGLGKAALSVDGENKNALNLYKKIGFVETDTSLMLKGEI